MNYDAFGKLLDRWTTDAVFRAAVRMDPLAAIAAAGLGLTEEEKAAVAAMDWSLPDAELAARVSLMPIV
jgi:hypothetical protein